MGVNYGKGLAKVIEPKLAGLGFQKDAELTSPRRNIYYYVRLQNDLEQRILFQRHRFSPEVTATLSMKRKGELANLGSVRIGTISQYKRDYWWPANSQEALERSLSEILELILDRGLQWFEGKIDIWEGFNTEDAEDDQ